MFKKSLIAVAVLGATAFSVQAADVTMYGKVDTGLQFKSNEVTVGNEAKIDSDTFSMETGRNARMTSFSLLLTPSTAAPAASSASPRPPATTT